MQAGFHRHGHKHSDCLSFIWWENGEYLLIDPGRYGYQTGAWRDCLMSTRSHNAVEIDGQDYERSLGQAYGSALQAVEPVGGDAWSLVARRAHGELQVDHERRLTYWPGRGLIVVDLLKNLDQGLRNFTPWWHPNAGHRLDGAVRRDGFTVDIGQGRRLVATCAVDTPDVACAPLTFHGALEPRRHGWWSPGYLRVEPATAIGFPFHSDEDITVVTLFEIVAADDIPALAIVRDGKGFKVSGWDETPLIIRL